MRFLLLSRQFLLLSLLDFSRAAITIIAIIGQFEQRTPSRLFGYSKKYERFLCGVAFFDRI